jgi:hypothetical protein
MIRRDFRSAAPEALLQGTAKALAAQLRAPGSDLLKLASEQDHLVGAVKLH